MGHFAITHFYPSELIALSIVKILCKALLSNSITLYSLGITILSLVSATEGSGATEMNFRLQKVLQTDSNFILLPHISEPTHQ